ncbi:MAG: NPCBM/NEW2 domain-containing protein [Muribaculaceae bacterium]|nr:NPCBM/NEW2 domain-containing protein [Muribaculaceae bacterium]
MKKFFLASLCAFLSCIASLAQTGKEPTFHSWAPTPPMGWNSWDCYGPTVVESEVKQNADYMAANLAEYGWEYVVVDIRWFVENDKAGGYNQTNPIYVIDEWGRYTPAVNRFPSAANGVGFKSLADYVHSKGLKFGIHIMRGCPKIAATKKCPIKGTDGITVDMIASNDSACTWLRDNYKVDWKKPGAQEYYNSIFELYADWGVDFVKVDDLSRPYHTAEVEMIRNAIDNSGRPIVLSISPGETPVDRVDHVRANANMWRTVDDFWDNWSQLNYQFEVCARWAPHIAPGTWPDADMLPLGKISIRGERGAERWTQFTTDEQYTMMNLWTIFKSPLMFGGDLPQNDDATNALLTNRDVLYMHHYSAGNREAHNYSNHITWSAIDPANGDRFAALFNVGGSEYIIEKDALYRSGTISYLTTGYQTQVQADIKPGTRQLALVVTDGGDGYDSDHADWINPTLLLDDGSTVDVTTLTMLRTECGWGEFHVNSNLEGGKLSIDGTKYDRGLAVHANSILIFDIPENTVGFTALAGIDNTGSDQGSKSSVEFFVFDYDPTVRNEYTDQWNGGNKLVKIDPSRQVACSGLITRSAAMPIVDLEAPIAGAEKLYLVVTNGGDNLSYDHADWANPVLVKANGEEVELTSTYSWDANPINGWNAPRRNLNNDGNTMKMGGEAYTKGIGCNAPSCIVYTLPAGHDYVSFKARVGLDDDVANAPFGASVEFRVYTESPEPDNEANVTLDLALLGFGTDDKVSVTELWTGENLGTYSGSEFAPRLREHASGLYRIAALDRNSGASVSLSTSTNDFTQPFDINVTVGGVSDLTDSYLQILRDGNVIATLAAADGGNVTYTHAPLEVDGTPHQFKARFSGTATMLPAESEAVTLSSAGIDTVAADLSDLAIIPRQSGMTVNAPNTTTLNIYNTAGQLIKSVHLHEGSNDISLAAGIYLAAGHLYSVH